jgi:hypothetical protein
MRMGHIAALLIVAALSLALSASGQTTRVDAIWARNSLGPITLDGVLDEPAWAEAESKLIIYAQDSGIPGSGWKSEGGVNPINETVATLKLLVHENQMFLGAVVSDESIGGSADFNRFDGLLMALKDHLDPNAPKPPAEYFYAWWYPENEDPQPPGQDPAFIGRWAEWPPGSARTPEQIAAWDAVTVVDGLSNDDDPLDVSYTVEMRFDLTPMGYDVTQPEGDIVEWNISIYDCDWFWPQDAAIFSCNRVWWQGPWGNAMWYNEVRVHARPDVTVESGPVPMIDPELVINEIDAVPTIDGELSEPVWDDAMIYSFDIRWNDDALRQTYPAVGPYRSGQFHPLVGGSQDPILDPSDATVKIFHRDDILYLGFDVRDLAVQFHPDFDRWDGLLVTLNDRVIHGPDNQLWARRISFQVDADGTALPQDYLVTLVGAGNAEVAVFLNPGTVVDTMGAEPDDGYQAELAIDLKALSYPAGLGDGNLFIGVNLLDGDTFDDIDVRTGSRTWWFREYENECCPTWAFLSGADPSSVDLPGGSDGGYALLNNYPNPSPHGVIRYSLPEASRVTLEVFDVQGRLLERKELGVQGAGLREALFNDAGKSNGIYLYRLRMFDPETGSLRAAPFGKMILFR